MSRPVGLVLTLLADLAADADLATTDRMTGLPGLRPFLYLVEGPDGTPALVAI